MKNPTCSIRILFFKDSGYSSFISCYWLYKIYIMFLPIEDLLLGRDASLSNSNFLLEIRIPGNLDGNSIPHFLELESINRFLMSYLNIPDGFTSAVRWYGNHFLDSLLCIPNHNFCWDICKDCYAPQMRQGLDKYPNRNG